MIVEIQQLQEQAEALREQGHAQEALVLLTEAYARLQDDSSEPESLLQQALLAMELERSEEALTAAQSYLEFEPDHPQALIVLSHGLVQQDRLSEATAILEHARKAAALNPTIDYNLASTYIRMGDFEAAIIAARRGYQQHPDFHPILKILSTALTYLDRFEEALQVAQQAILFEPEERWAWEILCATFYNLDRIRELSQALYEYLDCGPIDQHVLHWLQQFQGFGVAQKLMEYSDKLSGQGYLKDATDLALVAQQIMENSEDASVLQMGLSCHHSASLLLEIGRYTSAYQHAKKAIDYLQNAERASRSKTLIAQTLQAKILARLGRLSEAETVARQACEQWPHDLEDAISRATTLHTLGDILRQKAEMLGESQTLTEAEDRLSEALELRQHLLSSSHAQMAESLRALALLRRAQGRHDAQQRLLRDASQIARRAHGENHPEVASYSVDLAIGALEEGEPWKALDECSYSLDIYRTFHLDTLSCMGTILLIQAAAHRVLGQIPEAQEMVEQAKQNFTKSSEATLPYRVQRLHQNDIFSQAINAFLSLQHEMAYVALYEQRYSDAAYHLGLALRADPVHEKNLSLLNRLYQALPSLDAIEPQAGESSDISLLAIRAHLALQNQEVNRAFEYLHELHQVLPYAGFDRWAIRWLERKEIVSQLHVEWVMAFLASVMDQFPGRTVSHTAKHELKTFQPAILEVLRVHANNADIASLVSSYYRKLEDLKQALPLAHKACRLKPTWRSAIVLALCYEALERWDDAISTYEVALSDCSDPIPISLDLADLYRHLGRMKEASATYASVLKHEPEHEKALPYFLYCRTQYDATPEHHEAWRKYQHTHPNNPWVELLHQEITKTFHL